MGKDYRTKNEKLYDKLDETTKASWSYSDFVSQTNDLEKAVLRANPLGRDVTNEVNAGMNYRENLKNVLEESRNTSTRIRNENKENADKLKKK